MARALAHTHQFTSEEEAEIVRAFQAGEAAQSIAARLGLGTGKAVKRVLIENDAFVPNRRFSGMFSLADRAEIVRRYQAGETQRAIGESYGCTGGNIRALLVRENVFIRPMGNAPIDSRSEAILRRMRDDGAPIEAVADCLGVPKNRVRTWVRELGLPPLTGKTSRDLWATRSGWGYRTVQLSMDDPLWVMGNKEGQVLEHRLVIARAIGRPLTKSETVHHINGVRTDNRLENLQLRRGDHGQGVAFACLDCGSHNVGPVPLENYPPTLIP